MSKNIFLKLKEASPLNRNACVGENGLNDKKHYALGYFEASKVIVMDFYEKSEKGEYPSPDRMIYPFMFNFRHGMELLLKAIGESLMKLLYETKRSRVDKQKLLRQLSGTHSLKILWDKLKYISDKIKDKRLTIYIEKVEYKIFALSELDDSSQTFRYPENKDSQQHLKNISRLNVEVLEEEFKVLKDEIIGLYDLIKNLEYEYRYETYTKNLSRVDIYNLAKKLPKFNDWRKCLTPEYKRELREEFNVSSNELSKAIDLIKTHYEFAPLIGLELNLMSGLSVYSFLKNLNKLKVFLKNEPVYDAQDIYSFVRGVEYRKDFYSKLDEFNPGFVEELYVLGLTGRGEDITFLNLIEGYNKNYNFMKGEKKSKKDLYSKIYEARHRLLKDIIYSLVMLGYRSKVEEHPSFREIIQEYPERYNKESLFSYRDFLLYND